jgi:hypothetical protein
MEVFYARKCSVEFVCFFFPRSSLVETLNNKLTLACALLSPFASALLEEVKKNIKIH